jgi:hypothetical protein
MSRDREPRIPAAPADRAAPTRKVARLEMPSSEAATVASGADFAEVPLEQPGQALQEGEAPKASAGCGEEISWTPASPVPTDIRANSAVEFAANVDAVLGAGGHTNISIGFAPTVEKGKVTQVGLSVTSSIIRPRYAGGRPSEKELALIRRVETFIKEHEERHRDLSKAVMQQAVCDARNQPVASAKAIIKKAVCDKEPSAQEALDAKEGQLEWVKDSTGAVVDFKAVGAKHNYHVKDCDPTKPAPADEPLKGEGE